MEQTKIHLSGNELTLMQNSAWILTKNSVIEKVSIGLGILAARMQLLVQQHGSILLPEVVLSAAKISKGEKYQGLPYLILDYPRAFGKEHILAIRTLFWWGNYCSVTLHVRGRFVQDIRRRMKEEPVSKAGKEVFLSFSGDEWSHDLAGPAYKLIPAATPEGFTLTGADPGFIKIALKTPLAQWKTMEDELFESFAYLLRFLVH